MQKEFQKLQPLRKGPKQIIDPTDLKYILSDQKRNNKTHE